MSAFLSVPRSGDAESSLPAFLEQALGSRDQEAPLVRTPAASVNVTIDASGYRVARGTVSVALAADGVGARAWERSVNGVSRATPFGFETITVDGEKAEQYLTVTQRQGAKTWRWRLESGNLTPRLGADGAVGFLRGGRLSDVHIAPVALYDAHGREITPRGLEWSLDRGASAWWLELRLDDAALPLPYVIDPAATFRDASSTANAVPAPTLALLKPAAVAAGDLLLAQITADNTTTTLTAPSGWTLIRKDTVGSGVTALGQAVYYRVATDVEPPSHTWTFGDLIGASGAIVAYSGVRAAAPIDGASGGTGLAGTTPTAPSVTTTKADALLVAFFGLDGTAASFTPPAGMTTRSFVAGPATSAATADQTQAAPGASGARALSTTASGTWAAQLVALAPPDTIAPATPALTLSEAPASSAQHVAGTTLYYNPAAFNSGSFALDAATTDSDTGVQKVVFPGLAAGFTPLTPTDDTATPYTNTYSWSWGATETGAKTATAYDNAGNTSSATFTIMRDASGPTGHSVALSGGPVFTNGSVPLTLNHGSDAGGAGVDLTYVSLGRDSAQIVDGACGSFSGVWFGISLTGGADTNVSPGYCYRYRFMVRDNVGNNSSWSAPSADAVVVNSGVGFSSASSAGAGATTSLVLSKPSDARINDLLLAQVTINNNATAITAPAGWTLVRRDNTGSGQNQLGQAIYWKVVAAEPTSYTWTFGASVDAAGGILVERGALPSNPIDVSGSLGGSGTTVTAPSITTTASGDRLVAFFGSGSSTAFTPPSGMSERYDRGGGATAVSTADGNQAAAGATGTRAATAISAGSSAANIGQLVALRKDAAPPSTPTISLSDSSQNAFAAGSTIYYRPSAAGSFTVTASSSDAESGLQAIVLPGLASGFTPSVATAATSRTYSWAVGASDSGAKTVTAYDNAGNTATASFTLAADSTSPSGGSVSYPDGTDTDGVVTIATTPGTDTEAGVDAASGVLERQTAALAEGICGTFGGWSAVASPDTVPGATCARYRYRVLDNVGNEAVYTSGNTVKVDGDATPPAIPVITLSEAPASSVQHVAATTLYYNPSSLNSGTFTVGADTSDAESGIQRVAFPAISGMLGGGDDTQTPYGATYSWTRTSLAAGAQTVRAHNGAGGTSDASFTVTPDMVGPAVSISAPISAAAIRDGAALSAAATDLLSGTAAVEFRYCPGVVCTWDAAISIATDASAPYSVTWNAQPVDGTYTLLARATDNVANAADSLPVVLTVDNTAPASVLSALEGTRPDLQHFDAAGATFYYNPTAAGDFRFENAPNDAASGVDAVGFPGIAATGFGGAAKVDDVPLPYDSNPYSFDPTNTAAPPPHAIVVSDNAGNSTSDAVSFVRDVSPPSGGSVAYTDGYDADGEVTVATAAGSDAGAGIDSASGILERQTAALADGVCGSFGSWAQVTSPNTVVSGTCARYRYTVSDRVANAVTYVSASVAKVDRSAPSLAGVTLSESEPDEHVSGTTLFYNPSGGNAGTFTASAAPSDSESAIAEVEFPVAFGLDGVADSAAPYEASYSWSATSTASGANAVVAANGAGLTASASFTVTPDAAAPKVAIAAPVDGAAVREGATISAAANDVLSGPALVEFRFCPGTTCAWADASSIGGDTSPPFAVAWNAQPAEGAYTIVSRATDNVGNVGESLGVNLIVDNTPPIATQNDPGSPLAGVVELPATASDAGAGTATVTYEISPAGLERWSSIGTDSVAPYSFNWDTTTVADGRYDMRIRVTDRAGNEATSIPVRGRQVANLPPIVSISDPADFYVNGSAPDPFAITATSPETNLTQIAFFRCSDVSANCATGFWVSLGIDAAPPYSAPWSLDVDGNRALKAVATNTTGTDGVDVNNVVLDRTPPSGGSVGYADGYDADGLVSVSVDAGTDAVAGVDLASGLVERRTASLANGTCGTYGDWTPATTMPDVLPEASCARYRYRVADEAGNEALYTSTNVVMVDRTAPSVATVPPTELAGAGDQHFDAAGETLYFRPSGSGSFTLAATVSDAQSGAASARFPDLSASAGWTGAGGTDFSEPYASPTYAWSAGANAPGSVSVMALNAAGLTATGAIRIAADAAPPAGGSISYADGYDRDGMLDISTISGTDAGAGVDPASRILERRTAALADGACAPFGGPWTVALSSDMGAPGACAQYRFRVSDRVGNEVVYTSASVVKVDLVAPDVVLDDPGATLAGTVALTASASDAHSGVASLTYQRSPAGADEWTDVPASWDTTRIPDGLYDLRVIAADQAGNAATSAPVTSRRVDNRAPVVSLDVPGGYVNGSAPNPFPVTATSADGDIATVQLFRCDDQSSACATGAWISFGTGPSVPFTAAFDAGPDGNRAVKAVAVDAAGNAGAVVANLAIDRTAPAVELAATSHAVNTASADNTVDVSVSTLTESGSGVAGFSYEWTTDAATAPDMTQDADETAPGFASPPLGDGSSWYFHLRAVDNAGNGSRAIHVGPFVIDTTGPAGVSVRGAFATPFHLSTAVPIAWAAMEPVASFDIAARRAPSNGGFGASELWQSGTTATSATFAAVHGSTYCFSASGRDALGNTAAWSAERCTAVPLNNPSLVHSAYWVKKKAAGHYLNTYSASSRRGASLTRSGVAAKRLALVVTGCATCGTVGVYWNGRLVKKVGLAATTTRKKQLIPIATFASVQRGTFKLVVLSSAKPVMVEGLAISQQ